MKKTYSNPKLEFVIQSDKICNYIGSTQEYEFEICYCNFKYYIINQAYDLCMQYAEDPNYDQFPYGGEYKKESGSACKNKEFLEDYFCGDQK